MKFTCSLLLFKMGLLKNLKLHSCDIVVYNSNYLFGLHSLFLPQSS